MNCLELVSANSEYIFSTEPLPRLEELREHVHVAVGIGPGLRISDWIGELKGSSTHYLNRRLRRRIPFAWPSYHRTGSWLKPLFEKPAEAGYLFSVFFLPLPLPVPSPSPVPVFVRVFLS